MNRALLCLALFMASAVLAAGSRTEIRTPVEASAGTGAARVLEVRLANANLEVIVEPGERVAAAGTMATSHKASERARALAQTCGLVFRAQDQTLILEPRYPDGALGREARKGRVWFHLRLFIPASLPLGIYTKAGDITLREGVNADLVVEAGHGDIILDFAPAFREVDARTLSGRVWGFPACALKRFYFSPIGQRRLRLDPTGKHTAFLRTLRGNIILSTKDKP